MKVSYLLLLTLLLSLEAYSQTYINDKHIRHQQERMVFEQWDKKKFTPSTKLVGIEVNPLWYVVWGLHPNYRKKDHRPLGPIGPQTQRLALTASLTQIEKKYKKHSDTLRNIALKDYATQAPVPGPLWQLYYSKVLKGLLEDPPEKLLEGLAPDVRQYLITSKAYETQVNKLAVLKERLQGARESTMDRGNRILLYHKIMERYTATTEYWANILSYASRRATAFKRVEEIKRKNPDFNWTPQSEKELARKIVMDLEYISQ